LEDYKNGCNNAQGGNPDGQTVYVHYLNGAPNSFKIKRYLGREESPVGNQVR
jgi:hypothetical protein